MPDARKFPGMRRAVVPHMGARLAVVDEFVANGFPGLAAVVGTLDELTEPAGGLRSIKTIGVRGRAFEVIHLPTGKMRTADVPACPLGVGSENKRAFARAYQQSYTAHRLLLRGIFATLRGDGDFTCMGVRWAARTLEATQRFFVRSVNANDRNCHHERSLPMSLFNCKLKYATVEICRGGSRT